MSDNRKYYYLKLKENYFDEDAIVLLESMQDGILYSNILLKLYLKSLKNGGKLQLDENIPYTAQMIATITRQQVGTVERALQIFYEAGACRAAAKRRAVYEQHRTADRSILYRGGAETAGKAGFAGAKSLAKGRGGQMSTISSGHLSTRDRDRERDRDRKRERARVR